MNNTEEIWVTVNNYPNYEVSSFGRVKSKITNGLIKGWPNKNNHYWQVMLYNENGNRLYNLHRLVAEHFVEKEDEKMLIVGHKDGDRHNNHADNLFWKYKARKRNEAVGLPDISRKRRESPYKYVIKQMTHLGFVVAMYLNWDDLDSIGYNRVSIMQAAKGKYHTKNPNIYKGYRWTVERITK